MSAHKHMDSSGRFPLGWSFPARVQDVLRVVNAPINDDGRGPWWWMRLENGDLFLATAPRGALYEDLEVVTQLPPWFEPTTPRAIRHEIRADMDYLVDERGISVVFFRMPEHDQLYVGINSEDADHDNDREGNPILQVMLNDASLYDRERPKVEFLPAEAGPYKLRCVFRPQRDVDPGRPMTDVEDIDPTILGRAWHEMVWIAEYDEAPSEQRAEASDALRDHPDVPQWIKDWDGPYEIDFQVRFTVVGRYVRSGDRYAEAFWADDANHAEEQARDSARTSGGQLTIAATLYGEAMVAA